MSETLDLENLDLAAVAAQLRDACGPVVVGEVVGRTLLRDEVARELNCSQLEAEMLTDTMISRGFLVRQEGPEGAEWAIAVP